MYLYLYLNQSRTKYLYLYLKIQIIVLVFVFVFDKTYLTPVLDHGSHVLQIVVWLKPATYQSVYDAYATYILNHYTDATIVFDSYGQALSTKHFEQARQQQRSKSADIKIAAHLPTTTSKSDFLRNPYNKSQMIQATTPELTSKGIMVKQVESDADTSIVQTALDRAATECDTPVVVIGTDTDLLVMPLAKATRNMNLYMLVNRSPLSLYSIGSMQNWLQHLSKHLPFPHAVTGWDTSSALFNRGKRKAFNLARPNHTCHVSMDYLETHQLHMKISHQCWWANSLDSFRPVAYWKYLENGYSASTQWCCKASLAQSVQTQEWLGDKLQATDWGWKILGRALVPTPSEKPVTPPQLLHIISCSCKEMCERACGYKKTGLFCSDIWVNCKGKSCWLIELEGWFEKKGFNMEQIQKKLIHILNIFGQSHDIWVQVRRVIFF